jgi:hypothetical protein
MAARKIPSRFYTKIIEVNTPIRFYWVGKDFDGIEFGPISPLATPYQHRLLSELLEFVMALCKLNEQETPIPDYILRAFKEKKEEE